MGSLSHLTHPKLGLRAAGWASVASCLKVKPIRRLADGFGPRSIWLQDRVAEGMRKAYEQAAPSVGRHGS